ncbi:hypothetical protein MTR_6g071355 [Medicago truncatula]|uniref:Uncharacterized protein n=1 Tax=Medicago truncatula TaxID=3880 RepID=A0A072UBB1_MEDTR|nr:hypothetical protein MTR_6g071355 [Medicago truncatula]
MGEEVSLQWTSDEEKRFKDAMKLKIPSQSKSYWKNPSRCFQRNARKDVTPNTVDNDDDEVEFESFGDGFEGKAIKHSS